MKQITLHIETASGTREIALDGEVSIGRTNQARVALDDASLSRVHATVWREGDDVWIQDENSTNGTFVGGERITGERLITDADEIRLGNDTRIFIESEIQSQESGIGSRKPEAGELPRPQLPATNPKARITNSKSKIPLVPLIAAASIFVIIFFAVIGIFVARSFENKKTANGNPTPMIARSGALIPVRVIDPLGGEDPDDLDDLMASWEVEEKELNAADIDAINSTTVEGKESDLNVPIDFWQKQRDKALNHSSLGAEKAGLIPLPVELVGGGVPKQKAKLAELIAKGIYKQPLDFADLAELRLQGKLVELPMATENWVLDVGGSAGDGEFTSFDFDAGVAPIAPGSPKYKILQTLAENFSGQKYDLNNPRDRKQMRIRLLRMYNPQSRKILEEITKAYYDKFHLPLRITSLTRSMDYQISLNKTNANSFKVSGKGSLPPHTSGCAFDMSRKNLSADEQNFIMTLFSQMERNHRIDSLREGSDNACFHTFIYPDGIEPK